MDETPPNVYIGGMVAFAGVVLTQLLSRGLGTDWVAVTSAAMLAASVPALVGIYMWNSGWSSFRPGKWRARAANVVVVGGLLAWVGGATLIMFALKFLIGAVFVGAGIVVFLVQVFSANPEELAQAVKGAGRAKSAPPDREEAGEQAAHAQSQRVFPGRD